MLIPLLHSELRTFVNISSNNSEVSAYCAHISLFLNENIEPCITKGRILLSKLWNAIFAEVDREPPSCKRRHGNRLEMRITWWRES